MKNVVANIQANLPVLFLREGEHFIAFTPALDLSTVGKTYEEAKKRFDEAVEIFFEEIVKRGTLEQSLLDLGWAKHEGTLIPPQLIGQDHITVPLKFDAAKIDSLAKV